MKNKHDLSIVKVGGAVLDNTENLNSFMQAFAGMQGNRILVHGGGRTADTVMRKMGLQPEMVNGRRITNTQTLDIVTMVYAGLLNKNIVAKLQVLNVNAIGMCGADLNCISAAKRPVKDIDYGWVGDLTPEEINVNIFEQLIAIEAVPVLCALTHNKKGNLLNTNADTIAATLACALAKAYNVHLIYCFEKQGVLSHADDENSVINNLSKDRYESLKSEGGIHSGMLPKLDNAFAALEAGCRHVEITHFSTLNEPNTGTALTT